MHAVVEDRNQQYRVTSGDRILIAHNGELEPGQSITFDRVHVLTGDENGVGAQVGAPFVEGAKVTATVLRQDVKGPKLIIQKMRRRKNFRKRTGFRAVFTEVRIDEVSAV